MNLPRSARSFRFSTRRQVLRNGLLAGAAWAGLGPRALAASVSDEPELKHVRIGFVGVQSCASLIAAFEKGHFKRHGLDVTLVKESSWAAARDKIVSGENHGTHLKYGQAVGSTMGVLKAQRLPILAPLTLARGGSVFMVAASLQSRLTFDPQTWKTEIAATRARGESFTIAVPAPMGWHGLMYRHFLANAGVDMDKETKVITLPPAQMVQNIKVGTMQACAMVEPWGARGVGDKITTICMYGYEMWKDHPIKSFSVTEAFAEKYPKTLRAMLRAILEAAAWCDDFGNREELAKILAVPNYLNTSVRSILDPLLGRFDWGDGRSKESPENAIRYALAAEPQEREVKWFAAAFRRWGMIEGVPDYAAVAKRVARAEVHAEVCKELGRPAPEPNVARIPFWDGTSFDPAEPEQYAQSFAVHQRKG